MTQHGGPEVLQALEEELPEPKVGEVRVKVLAARISALDLMFRRSGVLSGHRIFLWGYAEGAQTEKLSESKRI